MSLLADASTTLRLNLHAVDYIILVVYFVFVIGIGFWLKRHVKTGDDFLLSGRGNAAWVAGLAFLSANLGAQELIGMGASGAKYGLMTSHFYWTGAVPAMVFVAIFMIPFYYGSKARSVPEYLKLRFDEKTRALNACSFAVMTIFSSGVSMYALAKLLETLLNWPFDFSLLVSAFIVLAYTFLGGLTAAIYNEVLQFFLIVLGFLPLALIGVRDVGGWEGLKQRLNEVSTAQHFQPETWSTVGRHLDSATANPMGVGWFPLVAGLGFVLSFGYWCTDFLVIQRAMSAQSMGAARRVPLIAAVPKMLLPFVVIVPGMVAIALTQHALNSGSGFQIPTDAKTGGLDYNMAVPALLGHYFPSGLLGLGLTALMASFMSGMAGNVTAFNTVWTYDIYQSYIKPGQSDQHYLNMGKAATVGGIVLSAGAAYLAAAFNNIMDMLQLVFAFVNAPLFATFLLGMFWKRSTGHGAFFGLLAGTVAAAIHHGVTLPADGHPGIKGAWLIGHAINTYPSEMAQNFWTAIWAFSTCIVVTVVVSLMTPRTKSDEELRGLVYSLTPKVVDEHPKWYWQPGFLGMVILVLMGGLIAVFW